MSSETIQDIHPPVAHDGAPLALARVDADLDAYYAETAKQDTKTKAATASAN
jgi:hypothetical protein